MKVSEWQRRTIFLLSVWILGLFSTSVARSQSFADSTHISIPDHGPTAIGYIHVSVDSIHLNSGFGLEKVCVTIHHNNDQQLGIYLMSPDGTLIELSTGNGGSGDDYLDCCFQMDALSLITSSLAPFNGSFIPEHNIGNINNGQNPNGDWRLLVQDLVLGDSGYLDRWSMQFGYTPPIPSSTSTGPCDDFHEPGCICPDSAHNCLLYPDMIVSQQMMADSFFQWERFDTLRLTSSMANIGYGPEEFIGSGQWYCGDSLVSGNVLCPDSSWSKQKVFQRIHIKTGLGYFDYMDSVVGYMSFHSSLGHHHLHIENWCQNSLRIPGPEVDATQWPVIASGNKVSFCLYDHLMCGTVFKNCGYGDSLYTYGSLANNGLGAGFDNCGSLAQGISVGYSDVYDYLLPGQEIALDSICSGNYVVVAAFDPTHSFIDGDRSNDVTVVPIHLKHQLPNCCHAHFEIDTIDEVTHSYRFIDRTVPIPDSIIWLFGDGSISSERFPFHSYSGSLHGQMQEIILTEDCTDTMRYNIDIDSSRSWIPPNTDDPLAIRIEPNPCGGFCHIDVFNSSTTIIHFEIYNSLGRCLQIENISVNPGTNQIPIKLNETGVLFVKLRQGAWEQQQKVVSLP